MKPVPAAELAGMLRRIADGREHIHVTDESPEWDDYETGFITFEFSGWTLQVFKGPEGFEYIASVTAPNRRRSVTLDWIVEDGTFSPPEKIVGSEVMGIVVLKFEEATR